MLTRRFGSETGREGRESLGGMTCTTQDVLVGAAKASSRTSSPDPKTTVNKPRRCRSRRVTRLPPRPICSQSANTVVAAAWRRPSVRPSNARSMCAGHAACTVARSGCRKTQLSPSSSEAAAATGHRAWTWWPPWNSSIGSEERGEQRGREAHGSWVLGAPAPVRGREARGSWFLALPLR